MARNRRAQPNDLLTDTLVLLRKIDLEVFDPRTLQMIANTRIRTNQIREGELSWFKKGYVLNDQPREFGITAEVMDATAGFAIARVDTGSIMAEFGPSEYRRAIEVMDNAQVQLNLDVILPAQEKAKRKQAVPAES